MSSTHHCHHGALREVQHLDAVLDAHRLRAHRTASIPEKIELIRTMSELRRTRTRVAAMPTAPTD